MSGFHIAPVICARAACSLAQKVNNMLADLLQRLTVVAHQKALGLGIIGETAKEVVSHSSNGIIPAQALVQAGLLSPRGCNRRHCDDPDTDECSHLVLHVVS